LKIFPKKKLLLHSCCAPCLTSVYERLAPRYDLVVFWYNPNIWPQAEHDKRLNVLKNYCQTIGAQIIIDEYDYKIEHAAWLKLIEGLEKCTEGGQRCVKCFEMRLIRTAKVATAKNFDYFATELSVSPHKNAETINTLGKAIQNFLPQLTPSPSNNYPEYLVSDFKKQDGFKRSVEICREHNIYRQNYCGCEFSIKNSPASHN